MIECSPSIERQAGRTRMCESPIRALTPGQKKIIIKRFFFTLAPQHNADQVGGVCPPDVLKATLIG